MTQDKPPIIDGRQPLIEERFNLDERSNWSKLQVKFREHEPIADEYDHYPHCKWVVIEYKSCSLKNAVEQIENTIKQLIDANQKVDHAVIVLDKFDGKERDLYRKVDNILLLKHTRKPVSIRISNQEILVNVYDPNEIEKQYQDYKGSLTRWQST